MNVEVDVIPGEPEIRTATFAINGSSAYRSKSSDIP
jgi:hypothetical protein